MVLNYAECALLSSCVRRKNWGAQAASLQQPAASRQSLEMFPASGRKRQVGSLRSPEFQSASEKDHPE
jgi:hypothetical protein